MKTSIFLLLIANVLPLLSQMLNFTCNTTNTTPKTVSLHSNCNTCPLFDSFNNRLPYGLQYPQNTLMCQRYNEYTNISNFGLQLSTDSSSLGIMDTTPPRTELIFPRMNLTWPGKFEIKAMMKTVPNTCNEMCVLQIKGIPADRLYLYSTWCMTFNVVNNSLVAKWTNNKDTFNTTTILDDISDRFHAIRVQYEPQTFRYWVWIDEVLKMENSCVSDIKNDRYFKMGIYAGPTDYLDDSTFHQLTYANVTTAYYAPTTTTIKTEL